MVPIDSQDDPKYLYCPECNHSMKANETETKDASLSFEGVTDAMSIVNAIYKDTDSASLEEKSVVTSQISSSMYEQWFEGFKAGQLATSLFHRRNSNDGKNRIEQQCSEREHNTGAERSGENVNIRENSFSESADPSVTGRPKRIREIIAGIEFEYDSHLIVPENIYMISAQLADDLKKGNIKNFSFNYNGSSLSVVIRDFS